MMTLNWQQIVGLFILAIPIACIARTVVYEEIFKEPREWCKTKSQTCRTIFFRKFFYLFTCEYCFSHYVTALFLFITGYKLLFEDWRGYLIAGFALVWVANQYMSLYGRLRLDIKEERVEIENKEQPTERGIKNEAQPISAQPLAVDGKRKQA